MLKQVDDMLQIIQSGKTAKDEKSKRRAKREDATLKDMRRITMTTSTRL